MAEASPLPEPPEDTRRTRDRAIAKRIAAQQEVAEGSRLKLNKQNYPASPTVADLIASQTPGGGKFHPAAGSTWGAPIGAFATETGGGAEFARPEPPKKKEKEKEKDKPTGPTGPARPQPQPQPSGPFSTNPELSKALQEHSQVGGDTWSDRAANHAANSAQYYLSDYQYDADRAIEGKPYLYPMGGQTLREIIHNAPEGYHAERAGGGGYIYAPTRPLPTIRDAQVAFLRQAQAANENAIGGVASGAGVIPSWNSPTGKPIDLSTGKPVDLQTDPIGASSPPSGWLQSALKAAKAGESYYNTGATQGDGNYPNAPIVATPKGTYAVTPSGGATNIAPASPAAPAIAAASVTPTTPTGAGVSDTFKKAAQFINTAQDDTDKLRYKIGGEQ